MDTPGEKLHIDLTGPTDPTIHMEVYCVVGWDEGSEYLKGLLLVDKAPVEVKRAYVVGYGGLRRHPRVLSSDNGGEFLAEFDLSPEPRDPP